MKSPWFKSMAKQILSMEFESIIEAHNSSPWRFIQSLILIGNIKAQFLLATSKPNSDWQHQSPILIGNIKAQFSLALLYQKEKSPRLSTLGKEKISCYRSKKRPWQSSYEETHWELSWGLCSCIMNPWNTWTSFCIMTSIIYTFYTRGKTFKPTSSSSKLLETMNIAIWNSS